MNREDFIIAIEKTELIYDDEDLKFYADNYFCNGESFEKNKEEFLKFLEDEK